MFHSFDMKNAFAAFLVLSKSYNDLSKEQMATGFQKKDLCLIDNLYDPYLEKGQPDTLFKVIRNCSYDVHK